MEDLYRKHVHVQRSLHDLEVLDIGGHTDYTSLRDQGVLWSQGVIVVYSITSRCSFEHVQSYCGQIQRLRKSAHSCTSRATDAPDDNKPSELGPLILVGNKSDCRDQRQVSISEGNALAEELGCNFTETTAKDHDSVKIAFLHILQQLSLHASMAHLTPVRRRDEVEYSHESKSSSSTACGCAKLRFDDSRAHKCIMS